MQTTSVSIYGDSLLRATVPDQNFRYHFTFQPFLDRITTALPVSLLNRAHFGATVKKGESLLERDISQGQVSDYMLLEYGGNDCNFDWSSVAQHPEANHFPMTELAKFTQAMRTMAKKILACGSTPVFMTLPPIDAHRYLSFICRDGLDRNSILHWLGDEQMIYRYQELYSDSIAKLASQEKLVCLDVRSAFLQRHDLSQLIAADGIHLSPQGYDFLFGLLFDALQGASTQAG